eukprot:351934-Chlamydomonas_euryale.AAC.14
MVLCEWRLCEWCYVNGGCVSDWCWTARLLIGHVTGHQLCDELVAQSVLGQLETGLAFTRVDGDWAHDWRLMVWLVVGRMTGVESLDWRLWLNAGLALIAVTHPTPMFPNISAAAATCSSE